ncbi:NADP-dependent oxidoreductase [Streptomyces sp. R302]|uniref:NADP-dependent oxidoreductase n=1 Tax=unclassified Streptomyces TaxID=2593676 RepID=UPI00145E80BE|nr:MULTISPECIES: NADP-dependent oxidoreductase [unclassified Streptomyces]NML52126.1 NADP-dependent oxidoreductase [Streptomyces sp. R301]NML82408.1 NADP-dependent oxidoreductase [Streptomyces sp. R302]
MDAIVFEEFGGPEVLRYETGAEVPEPGPGEVRLRVAAAGVNPVDWKTRSGLMTEFHPTAFPAVAGIEVAGTVDAIGEGVTGLAVGDEVFGWARSGGYAQYALAGAAEVLPKPTGLSWEAAVGLPVAGETAARVLEQLGVREGETLFLHGAAGVVGTIAVQLAVAAGVTVVGSASAANHDYLRGLGAIPVAYGDGLADRVRAAAPGGVDAVFDAAGFGVLPLAIELAGKERVVTIAATDADEHGVLFSVPETDFGRVRGWLRAQAEGVLAGTLRLRHADTLPLKEAARAQELSEAGHVRGKLVLAP